MKEIFYINNLLIEGRIEDVRSKYTKISENDFNLFVDGDPSGNQKYLEWMVKMYESNWVLGVDPYYIIDLTQQFHNNINKLKNKDLYSYKNIEDLRKDVENIIDNISKSELKRIEKSGSDKIYEDDYYLVVRPKTEKASCHYGSNSKWCTAAKKGNMFNEYNENGVLIYIIDKEIEKPNKHNYIIDVHGEIGDVDPDFQELSPRGNYYNDLEYYNEYNRIAVFIPYKDYIMNMDYPFNLNDYQIFDGSDETMDDMDITEYFQRGSGVGHLVENLINDYILNIISEYDPNPVISGLIRGLSNNNELNNYYVTKICGLDCLNIFIVSYKFKFVLTQDETYGTIYVRTSVFDRNTNNSVLEISKLPLKVGEDVRLDDKGFDPLVVTLLSGMIMDIIDHVNSVVNKKPLTEGLIIENRVDDVKKKYLDKYIDEILTNEDRNNPTRKNEHTDYFNTMVDYYSSNDPSGNNKYLDWMINTWISWLLLTDEDEIIDIIINQIGKFHDNLNRLTGQVIIDALDLDGFDPRTERLYNNPKDINKYNLNDLISVTKYLGRMGEKRKSEKDVDVVYQDDILLVVRPNTLESSCKYGSTTKWCTAAKNDNHFETYHEDGNLFYYIWKVKLPDSKSNYQKIARYIPFGSEYGDEGEWFLTNDDPIEGRLVILNLLNANPKYNTTTQEYQYTYNKKYESIYDTWEKAWIAVDTFHAKDQLKK